MSNDKYTWDRKHPEGYEVSSQGDKRFSALYAKMPDGRTIEQWYQCDVKGYDIKGRNWKAGKGKPSLFEYPEGQQWEMYLSLWKFWAIQNQTLILELKEKLEEENITVFTDMFANTSINQARALAWIFNNWIDPA